MYGGKRDNDPETFSGNASFGQEARLARYHLGIDVGKRRHHACVLDTETGAYSKVLSFTVDRKGFEKLLTLVDGYGPKEDFLVGIESSGPYGLTIAYFLLQLSYNLVEVNSFQASQFRKAQGKKAKTDRVDARSLAAFLGVGSHKPLTLTDPVVENLRELTRFRADLSQDRTRQVNRLHQTLTTSFPELASHLASVDSATALQLLYSCPGPQSLVEAGVEAVTATLVKHSRGHLGTQQAENIVQAASSTVGLLRRHEALSLKLEVLTQTILSLNAQLQRIEAEIEDLFSQLPYDPSDFPVGGVQALASIIAEVDDVHRFSTLKQFLSHFGWCPNTFQSGDFRLEHPKMSHAGNSYVRRMVWMLAVAAIRSVPAYTAYFQRRCAAGKKKMHSIVAIGRKILSVMYAILKTGVPYDPNQATPAQLALPILTST